MQVPAWLNVIVPVSSVHTPADATSTVIPGVTPLVLVAAGVYVAPIAWEPTTALVQSRVWLPLSMVRTWWAVGASL